MFTRSLLTGALLALLLTTVTPAAQDRPRETPQPAERIPFPGVDISDDEADDETSDEPRPFAEHFLTDPRDSPEIVVSGQPLERLRWAADAPAYPGDLPGSFRATYDANAEAGLFGLSLPQPYDQQSTFSAAAAFVIHSDGYHADPDGFFQISWGLWNSVTTGLNRTGSAEDYSGDTFELIEFDYFPNVSPWFGGPFVAPTIFGRAAVDDPSFEFNGAFANLTSLFGLQVDLPLDLPLLAVLEHRPGLDATTVQVYRIVSADGVLSLQGAVGPVSLDWLVLREYTVDTVGLTLWSDGFSGPDPSVTATVTYHAWVVLPGLTRPEELLRAVTGR